MSEHIHEFTTQNFEAEVLKSEIPVLVDLWAPWCAPCRMIAPVVEQIAEENIGKAKIGKVNIDESPEIAQKYGVTSIPTILVFKDGKPAASQVGLAFKPKLQEMIDSCL